MGDIVKNVKGGQSGEEMVFKQRAWDDATRAVGTAYAGEGYLYARIDPVIERTFSGRDSIPTVNLRWDITEGVPAIVNRIDIKGNDRTSETCIRDQLFILPRHSSSQDNLIPTPHHLTLLASS